jgi:hypothetical protein
MIFLLFNLGIMNFTRLYMISRLTMLLLFCSGILYTPILKAQGQIGFNPGALLQLQDTVLTYNASVTFYFGLQNTGSTPFQGTVDIYMSVLDSTGSTFSTGIEGSVSQLVLLPGDTTASDSLQIAVSPARFPAGGGIVVIWPSAPGFGTPDTFKQQVHVSFPTGISDRILNQSLLQVYPNPAQDYFCFPLAEVRSYHGYNLRGARIGSLLSDAQGCVPRPAWPAGQYLLLDELSQSVYRLVLNDAK